ncbi:MAG: hypothetical protein HRU20_31345 [Pseudomonadales bacterium]|nr:hypothetical protein [Pseudomonadales bacterium]
MHKLPCLTLLTIVTALSACSDSGSSQGETQANVEQGENYRSTDSLQQTELNDSENETVQNLTEELLGSDSLHSPTNANKNTALINDPSVADSENQNNSQANNIEAISSENLEGNEWRVNYMSTAEQTLRDAYSEQTFPEETYQWLVDNGFKSSLLQAVGPDARVLNNIHDMRNKLDTDIADKYKNLVFAIAVARRVEGVGSVEYNSNRFSKIATQQAPSNKDSLKKEHAQALVTAIRPLMLDKQWDTAAAYANADEVISFLQVLPELAELKYAKFETPTHIAAILYDYNVSTGVISPRDKNANAVQYINHIAKIHTLYAASFVSKKETINWPEVFPHNAPWPLLMPLAEMRPVSEMQYIWDRFSDESVQGNFRLRKYGNYRTTDVAAPFLAATQYPKSSLQYSNEVGGVCGTMSMLGRGSYVSLGVPSMAAGQPKHALLMRYTYDSNSGHYLAQTEQSVSSLYETTPDWHFLEDNSERTKKAGRVASGEYVMGLALAMNEELQDYLDSRTLVRLAAQLDANKGQDKLQMLSSAVQKSPYNAEAWYDYFASLDGDFDAAVQLINQLRTALPTSNDNLYGATQGDATKDLSDLAIEPSDSDTVKAAYRDTVIAALLTLSFDRSLISKDGQEVAEDDLSFITNENSDNQYDLTRFYSMHAFEQNRDIPLPIDKVRQKVIKAAQQAAQDEVDRQKKIVDLQAEIDSGTLANWRVENKTVKITELEEQSRLYLESIAN